MPTQDTDTTIEIATNNAASTTTEVNNFSTDTAITTTKADNTTQFQNATTGASTVSDTLMITTGNPTTTEAAKTSTTLSPQIFRYRPTPPVPTEISSTYFIIRIIDFNIYEINSYDIQWKYFYFILVWCPSYQKCPPEREADLYSLDEIGNHTDGLHLVGIIDARRYNIYDVKFKIGGGSKRKRRETTKTSTTKSSIRQFGPSPPALVKVSFAHFIIAIPKFFLGQLIGVYSEFMVTVTCKYYYIILVWCTSYQECPPERMAYSYSWDEIGNHTDGLHLVGLIDASNETILFKIGGDSKRKRRDTIMTPANPPLQEGAVYTSYVIGVVANGDMFASSYTDLVIIDKLTTATIATETISTTTTALIPNTVSPLPTTSEALTTAYLTTTTLPPLTSTVETSARETSSSGTSVTTITAAFTNTTIPISSNYVAPTTSTDSPLTTNTSAALTITTVPSSKIESDALASSATTTADPPSATTSELLVMTTTSATATSSPSIAAGESSSSTTIFIASTNTTVPSSTQTSAASTTNAASTTSTAFSSTATSEALITTTTASSTITTTPLSSTSVAPTTVAAAITTNVPPLMAASEASTTAFTAASITNSLTPSTTTSAAPTITAALTTTTSSPSVAAGETSTTTTFIASATDNAFSSTSTATITTTAYLTATASETITNNPLSTATNKASTITTTAASSITIVSSLITINVDSTTAAAPTTATIVSTKATTVAQTSITASAATTKIAVPVRPTTLITTTAESFTFNLTECLATCKLANSKCIDTNGSYVCTCNNGLQFDANKTSCVDINKCEVYKPCSWPYGRCNNTNSSYICSCIGNWVISPTNDSCIGNQPTGVSSSTFEITIESFDTIEIILYIFVIIRKQIKLEIPKKYPHLYSSEDIDNHVDGWHRYARIDGKSKKFRFRNSDVKSKRKRRSIDNFVLEDGQLYTIFLQAQTNTSLLASPYYPPVVTATPGALCTNISCFSYKNQTCQLLNSTSAKCLCKNGYITFDSWSTCEDINECTSTQNNCNLKNSKCVNTDGSFFCLCNHGFILGSDGKSCDDVNECSMLCQNRSCINTAGSYLCLCPTGSFYNTTSDLCQDIDECAAITQTCDPIRGICINENVLLTNQTYNCSCPIGWNLAKNNICIDINECINSCKENSSCKNTEGSFICICKSGFKFNENTLQCEKSNSCLNACPLNSNCTMTSYGQFDCVCKHGYLMNNLMQCEEINECKTYLPYQCTKSHEVCSSTVGGGITCNCRKGFELVGDVCKELSLNSCGIASQLNVSVCPSDQRCTPEASSFGCICADGYFKNSSNLCEDIDECKVENKCSQNSQCKNTNGGYVCECNEGYYGNNVTDPSLLQCYRNSFWTSWEQAGQCTQLCKTDQTVGTILFTRKCQKSGPVSSCEGVNTKQELCNTDFCDNKLKISKRTQCENWENMNFDSAMFQLNSDVWLHKLLAWVGYNSKVSTCKVIIDSAFAFYSNLLELETDIALLKRMKLSLRNIIDCNTNIQKNTILLQQYSSVQSKLVIDISIKTAFRKLQARNSLQKKNCMLDAAVDGGFNDWSDFKSCTKTCGGGVQTKIRECNKPTPQNGGKDCIGFKTETRGCNFDLCPAVDGGLSDWSDFSSCTKTCGGGMQIKTRDCDNPKPQNGGKDCIGIKVETRGCKNNSCNAPVEVSSTYFVIKIPEFDVVNDTIEYYYIILIWCPSYQECPPEREPNSYSWDEIANHTDGLYLVGKVSAINASIPFKVGGGSNRKRRDTIPTPNNGPLQPGGVYATFAIGVTANNTMYTSSYSAIVVTGDNATTTTITTETISTTSVSKTITTPPLTATSKASITVTNSASTTTTNPFSITTAASSSTSLSETMTTATTVDSTTTTLAPSVAASEASTTLTTASSTITTVSPLTTTSVAPTINAASSTTTASSSIASSETTTTATTVGSTTTTLAPSVAASGTSTTSTTASLTTTTVLSSTATSETSTTAASQDSTTTTQAPSVAASEASTILTTASSTTTTVSPLTTTSVAPTTTAAPTTTTVLLSTASSETTTTATTVGTTTTTPPPSIAASEASTTLTTASLTTTTVSSLTTMSIASTTIAAPTTTTVSPSTASSEESTTASSTTITVSPLATTSVAPTHTGFSTTTTVSPSTASSEASTTVNTLASSETASSETTITATTVGTTSTTPAPSVAASEASTTSTIVSLTTTTDLPPTAISETSITATSLDLTKTTHALSVAASGTSTTSPTASLTTTTVLPPTASSETSTTSTSLDSTTTTQAPSVAASEVSTTSTTESSITTTVLSLTATSVTSTTAASLDSTTTTQAPSVAASEASTILSTVSSTTTTVFPLTTTSVAPTTTAAPTTTTVLLSTASSETSTTSTSLDSTTTTQAPLVAASEVSTTSTTASSITTTVLSSTATSETSTTPTSLVTTTNAPSIAASETSTTATSLDSTATTQAPSVAASEVSTTSTTASSITTTVLPPTATSETSTTATSLDLTTTTRAPSVAASEVSITSTTASSITTTVLSSTATSETSATAASLDSTTTTQAPSVAASAVSTTSTNASSTTTTVLHSTSTSETSTTPTILDSTTNAPSIAASETSTTSSTAALSTTPALIGFDGVMKAQLLVNDFLSNFYNASNPGKLISGKSLKAIFEIQKAVADEFISVDPTSRKPVDTLLKELEEFLVIAAEGGSIDFARVTLGKSLFNFIKKEITNGKPIDDINKASEGYLYKIKSQIGDDKFSQIISSQGASTLMFVIDTTGSMTGQIDAAKGIAKAIIETTREFPVDYILSLFNDPDLGPVVYKSEKERADIINTISNIIVTGGGDCPELAFGGMLNAFSKGPQYSSPMFVFTDASAKDDTKSNIDALKGLASSYSTPITFFTNHDGCGSGIDSFNQIASHTSGQVFPLKDDKEIISFIEYVKSCLQQDTVIASGETSIGSRIKRQALTSYEFYVDDGIEKIIVSASTSTLYAASFIQLRFEDGRQASPNTNTSMTQIYQIKNSETGFYGKWTLLLPSNAGEYKYSVQAISSDPIDFFSSFSYQQHPTNNSPVYLFSDPIKGLENNLIVRVAGGNINLSTFKCQILNLKGSSLLDLSLLVQENGVFSAKFTPPASPFKQKCYGLTKNGSNFERISFGVFEAKTAFMVPIFAGNMFTVRSSNTVDAEVMVFNFDNEESITFTVTASKGNISPSIQTLTIRENAFIKFNYSAPSSSTLVGTTTRVTVSAQRDVSKESFSTTFSVLIV